MYLILCDLYLLLRVPDLIFILLQIQVNFFYCLVQFSQLLFKVDNFLIFLLH
jgi:hypothetical protein